MRYLLLAGLCMFVAVNTASADEKDKTLDKVVLSLSEEGWVTTNSADVNVAFNIIQQKETVDELKSEVLASLEKLAKSTDWHVTSSRETKDQTGLNRWYISATARVGEGQISGLNDRAKSLSRPGFKASVVGVNFAPSLDEVNQLKMKLRANIYGKAKLEAESLSKAIGGKAYQVHLVDFVPGAIEHARPVTMAMHKSMASPMMERDTGGASGGSKIPVSRKHTLSAVVVLARNAE